VLQQARYQVLRWQGCLSTWGTGMLGKPRSVKLVLQFDHTLLEVFGEALLHLLFHD
jgi:hypothetical protein